MRYGLAPFGDWNGSTQINSIQAKACTPTHAASLPSVGVQASACLKP